MAEPRIGKNGGEKSAADFPNPTPKHDPKTMSYAAGKTEPIKTDRGEFAFRKNGERK